MSLLVQISSTSPPVQWVSGNPLIQWVSCTKQMSDFVFRSWSFFLSGHLVHWHWKKQTRNPPSEAVQRERHDTVGESESSSMGQVTFLGESSTWRNTGKKARTKEGREAQGSAQVKYYTGGIQVKSKTQRWRDKKVNTHKNYNNLYRLLTGLRKDKTLIHKEA